MGIVDANQLCLFLTWFVYVSGSTSDYSITIGETVTMSCHFGEGIVQNVYWYFGNSTASQHILSLYKGQLSVDDSYENRVKLLDNNTLVLEGVTVEDEGTYRCDVDRIDDTSVVNLQSELRVFGLNENASPVITQCMASGNLHQCEYLVVEDLPIDLSCELHGFYPEGDVSLAWYWDTGNAISSSSDGPTRNNDGTFLIVSSISIHPDGRQRIWCNASFPTVDVMVNKGTSVYVINEGLNVNTSPVITQCMDSGNPHHCEYHVTEDPPIDLSCELHDFYPEGDVSLAWYWDTGNVISSSSDGPTRNSDGTFSIVSSISIHPDGIQRIWCNASFPTVDVMVNKGTSVYLIYEDTHSKNTTIIVLSVIIPGAIALIVIVIICRIYKSTKYAEVAQSVDGPADEGHGQGQLQNIEAAVKLTDEQLEEVATKLPDGKYHKFCRTLAGKDHNEAQRILIENMNDYKKALMKVMVEWNDKKDSYMIGFKVALDKADAGGLKLSF